MDLLTEIDRAIETEIFKTSPPENGQVVGVAKMWIEEPIFNKFSLVDLTIPAVVDSWPRRFSQESDLTHLLDEKMQEKGYSLRHERKEDGRHFVTYYAYTDKGAWEVLGETYEEAVAKASVLSTRLLEWAILQRGEGE